MIKHLFTPPALADTGRARQAKILFQLLWGIVAIVSVFLCADMLFLPANVFRWLTIMLVMDSACLGLLVLNRRGRIRLASHLLLWQLFAVTTAMAWTAGGISSQITAMMLLLPLVAGLLLGWRSGVFAGMVIALLELGLISAQKTGIMPPNTVHHTLMTLWVSHVAAIGLLLYLQFLAVSNITKSLEATKAELALRQEAEAALRKSEEFRQRIFDTSRVPIVVVDIETLQCLDCNPAAAQIYHLDSREVCLAKTVLDVSAPVQYDGTPSAEKARFYIQQAVAKGAVVFEWRHQRPGGEIWDAEVHLMSFHSGSRPLLQFTLEDISERRQIQSSLQEQAALLDASHDAIIVWDINSGIKFLNPAAEKMTGQTLRDAKFQPLSFLLRTRSELILKSTIQEVIAQGQWTGDLVLLTAEGRPRDVATRWIALKEAHGKPASVLITGNDITEQKQLQARYLRAQRLESIGTLASGVAHDLNNILSPILMGVDMLETTVEDADSRDTVAMMKDSARRGRDTVKQLLTFARGADSQKGVVQPRHLIKEIARLIQQTFPKNIQVYSDFTGQPATVLADPSQLHQVLMNLCVNSRDAMPEGGVLFLGLKNITLDASTAKMHPKARPIAYVVFEVSDSGTGIPPDVIERIFDPFFTTKTQGKGTGLGLSTVLGIVENHDGFVQVESSVGNGAKFQIFIPASVTELEPAAGVELPTAPRGQGEFILVVDDESAILRTTESVLRKGGYETMTVGNASEAVHLFERYNDRIKAVLTDVMMPFGDGRSLIIMLYEQNPKLPIIAMSGLSTTELQQDLKTRGACKFLAKPFSAEQLLGCVAEALQTGRS
jgi:PAS domain S-box-containing protein